MKADFLKGSKMAGKKPDYHSFPSAMFSFTDHSKELEDKIAKISKSQQQVLDFAETQPTYEALCGEIAYILRKRLKKDKIEVASITFRAKSLQSFFDKASKLEISPHEIRDRAGVRVVYLYKTDRDQIEKAIRNEFDVVDTKDISADSPADRFGYEDVKFYVKLKKQKQKGARYDDLKNLVCEIQVRTVAQDAWSIISHHLVYKKEAQIPKEYQKELNRLVALFQMADEQFVTIRTSINKYRQKIEAEEESKFLQLLINLDTLTAFMRRYFPSLVSEYSVRRVELLLLTDLIERLNKAGYVKLKKLHTVLINNKKSGFWFELMRRSQRYPSITMSLEIALSLADKSYKDKFCKEELKTIVDLFEDLFTKFGPEMNKKLGLK